jgi:hypothetical protein
MSAVLELRYVGLLGSIGAGSLGWSAFADEVDGQGG